MNPSLDEVVKRSLRRLIPFLLLMYVLSFLDRTNIGFAKQNFQLDTGLSDAAYALGAGLFFVGYAVLEIPSNLIMQRVGARLWLARIMITWGLISAAMMFAHTEAVFYALRFALGVAEAGFFPGVILYLTYWIPARHRGRANGLLYFGAPLAFIFGGPLSGLLLEFDGAAGLHGWQWMFLVEGLLATVVGVWALWYLEDRPDTSRRLTAAEREVLVAAMAEDERARAAHSPGTVLRALRHPRVLYLSVIYFCIQVSVYGVTFYLPTQVAGLVGEDVGLTVGLITAIPWTCALIASFLVGRLSDVTGARRTIAAVTLAVGGLGIAASAAAGQPGLGLTALCFAAAGFIAVQPVFWTLPMGLLAGSAAAGGLALVNSLGSLGGFVAPNVKTWADAAFGGSTAGLYLLAVVTLAGAVMIAFLGGLRGRVPAETMQTIPKGTS
ncbi:MFS transporter [Nonomuraea sp. K274]|uniref:MFS transporter n=1 Tax=Nonomuraea cypriaca TaxID=1187855 RepID=A0A931F3L5_9ACTN|nr:MFS transporter [Nonomuraea cypriaca]MBF8191752.1 MFS transporter [Nonomuraea cypriaca]